MKPLLSGRSEPPKPTTTEMFGTPLSGVSVSTINIIFFSLFPRSFIPSFAVLLSYTVAAN